MDAAAAFCFLFVLATTTVSVVYAQQPNSGCFTSERDALLSFRGGISSDPQKLLASWNGQDCCKWSGVECSNKTGHVVKIDIRNTFFLDDMFGFSYSDNPHGMRGKINSSLLALEHLEYLDLSGNYLGGEGVPIPKFLGSFHNLVYLNLSSMSFDGAVPPQLGNLSRLQYLVLDHSWNYNNLYTQDISWLLHLPLLRFLDMSGVKFRTISNWVHIINRIHNLRALHLEDCALVSPYTPIVHPNLTSLQMLDLKDNSLNQFDFSYWFWDVGTIRHLDLTNNFIVGPLSDAIGNMTSLEVLGLGGNQITTVNLKPLKNLCNLRVLTLWSNQINQDVSEFLEGLPHCAWSKLEFLDLSVTNLSGEIPNWINQLSNLSILKLSSNRLIGPIPLEIGMLSNLRELYLDGNTFNGSILEEHLVSLVSLEDLDLSYNSLNIMISSNWIPPFKLRLAYFPHSKMGPHFPLWLKGQMDVIYLDISDTGIVDHLPDWFWTVFSNIQYLNISCNQISGRLPRTLEFMSTAVILDLNSNNFIGILPQLPMHLTELDISKNSLSGPLPRSFGAPYLSDLLLSENNINGTIPTYICQLQILRVLDLARNHLVGQFPSCSEGSEVTQKSTISISALVLYENNLSGEFPSYLKRCPELILLDLAHNKFTGKIPTWIAKQLPDLSYLRLRHNIFSGSIPVQLTELGYLQYLDLAYNRITGNIPHTLANLKAMTQDHRQTLGEPLTWGYGRPENPDTDLPPKYDDSLGVVTKGQYLNYTGNIIYMVGLDLSCNSLVGEIPDEITALNGLNNLNISHNQLNGRIPEKIGLLGSLESLDLSCNELSSGIPSGLTDMTTLSKLNLSYNNLSGGIPLGNQLQVLIDPASSFIGNNYLCGPPLSRNCSGPRVHNLDEHQPEPRHFYLGLAAGFVMGLWVVFIIFLFVKTWRVAYFKLFDKLLASIQTSVA